MEMTADREYKRKMAKAGLGFTVILVLDMAIEAQITWILTKNGIEKSTTLLVNQVEIMLDENAEDEKERTDELKDNYISYARSVAYILDEDPEIIEDIDGLKKIAELEQIDEIHIFDETGTIIAGTVPEYYGFNFDSGEQMEYFKPMLEDKTLAMCQDVTPNTAEGKSMMYSIVWNSDGTYMIQLGIEPKRLLEELKRNDISNVISNIPITEGFDIYVVDTEKAEITATTDKSDISLNVSLSDYTQKIKKDDSGSGKGIIRYKGTPYFCSYKHTNGYVVAVAYNMKNNIASMIIPLIIFTLYMLIAETGILKLIAQFYRSEEKMNVLNENLGKANRDLIEASAQAEAANMAKSAFLFNMSHDIRTPMNAIIGFTNLIEKHYDDKEKCMDYIHKTQQANQFLLSLINDVLEMARIESGKESLDEDVCPVGSIAEESADIFREQMEKKGITFESNIETKTKWAFCDKTKVSKIYLNILSNAFKYTPAGGKITMQVNELPCDRPGYILMKAVFTDTGRGMSEEYLPHLFESFSREQTSTQSRQQGTGLGMPIVKNIIDFLGGTIDVESKLGKGTTFTVTYPLKTAGAEPKEAEESRNGEAISFAGKRILLAEDNDLNAEIAVEILGEAGFEVERAADGIICVDMLRKADEHYYDVILMDVQMPNMDGYTATRTIRALDDQVRSQIPIIAMTANAFDEDKKNALEAGMNGHLSKPIEIPKLMETLGTVLTQKKGE